MNDSKRTNHKKAHHPHPPVHAKTRPDDGNAFFPDPGQGPARVKDDLAEELAEEFVESATSGEEGGEESLNADVPEDSGGPFVQTTGGTEFADGTDASNPEEATREPFPKA